MLGLVAFALLTFYSGHVGASVRGIPIKVLSKGGVKKEITLYSGYYALVVGCGKYREWPELPNPPRDAMQVARALKYLGFRVRVLLNPTSSQLKRALNSLVVTQGQKKDVGILFYFAGHGHTIEEIGGKPLGYIVPVDAPDPDRDSVGFLDKAISMRQIESYAKLMKSKHVLMLFDSCFSGAIFALGRARPSQYIREKVSLPVREFITAGNENEQVSDQSVFKQCFLVGVRDGDADLNGDGYITGEELGSYLQERVVNYTSGAQHPQFGKIRDPMLDRGDFVFVPRELYEKAQKEKEETPKPHIQKKVQLSSVQKERGEGVAKETERAKKVEQKPSGATLVVETEPPGARVYLNNKLLGKSPVTMEGVATGEGIVRIELDGFETRLKRIRLKEGATVELSVVLKPAGKIQKAAETKPPVLTGTLTVKTDPEDARVRILNIRPRYHDGIELKPGRYLIEVSKPGFRTVKRWIRLDAEEDKEVYVELVEVPPDELAPSEVALRSSSSKDSKTGWLGVKVEDLSREAMEKAGLSRPAGALVKEVVTDSPADKAGIRAGDVILQYGRVRVRSANHLNRLVSSTRPGRRVSLLVVREGWQRRVSLKLLSLLEGKKLAMKRPGAVWRDPYLGMEFVYVPGGCYQMGCGSWTDECNDDEYPVHEVCVDEFWMGRYEVTYEQFFKFLKEIKQDVTVNTTNYVVSYRGKPIFDICENCDGDWKSGITFEGVNFLLKNTVKNYPVIYVTWYGAKFFADWLSRKTGYKFRLPSEAEWEYACRNGGKPVKYPWGQLNPVCRKGAKNGAKFWGCSPHTTEPVGSYAPSELGLFDMAGNVWEWCEDIYSKDAYKYHSRNNPIYTGSGSNRVVRGGGWLDGPSYIRCADRSYDSPDGGNWLLGFRLLRSK